MRLRNNLFLRPFKIYQQSDNILVTYLLLLCFKSPYLLPRLLQQPPKRFSCFYLCPSIICSQHKSQSYFHKYQSNEATVVIKTFHDSPFYSKEKQSLSSGLHGPPYLSPHLTTLSHLLTTSLLFLSTQSCITFKASALGTIFSAPNHLPPPSWPFG